MELANGKEGGLTYRVYLEAPNWIAEVTNSKGVRKTESWEWYCAPRCGPDALDVAKTEEVLDRLIESFKGGSSAKIEETIDIKKEYEIKPWSLPEFIESLRKRGLI